MSGIGIPVLEVRLQTKVFFSSLFPFYHKMYKSNVGRIVSYKFIGDGLKHYQFTIASIINSAVEIKKSIKISVEKKGCLLPCSDFRLYPDPYKTNPDSEHCL